MTNLTDKDILKKTIAPEQYDSIDIFRSQQRSFGGAKHPRSAMEPPKAGEETREIGAFCSFR